MSSNLPTNATHQPEDQATAFQATYAGAKRRIAALELQLQALQETGKKSKSAGISNVNQGRALCRLVSLFDPVNEIVNESDRRRGLEADLENEDEELEPEAPTTDQARTFRAYKLLTFHIPSVENKLVEMEPYELEMYFKDLRKGAGGARGDDAANMKPSVISWIAALVENPIPPLEPTTKMDRGFEHDVTGRLLCPIDYDWNDLEIRQKIREGDPKYIITADCWPAFLYPHGKADLRNMTEDLFRSAILVKAFKFIFTSPTSAQDIDCEIVENAPRPIKRARNHKAPTRGHIANLMGMRTVTPRSIAYIATQLRFALSNASAWHESDGCFNYLTFYNNIVDFFEVTPGPEARHQAQILLSWWTSKVFGSHTFPATRNQSHGESSVARLAEQRAARELAARNPAAST